MLPSSLPTSFHQAFDNIGKVKLHGGVVGKVSTVLMYACVGFTVMAGTALCAGYPWVAVLCIAVLAALVFTLPIMLIGFADRNPQAALLEGAEFLAHQKMVLGKKSLPVLPESQSKAIAAPSKPVIEEYSSAALADVDFVEIFNEALSGPIATAGNLANVATPKE